MLQRLRVNQGASLRERLLKNQAMLLWTGPSRAEHYCPLHPDLTQQHCHFSFCVCVWVCVKELPSFHTTGDSGGGGGGGVGVGEVNLRLGVMWKSHILKWRVQKQQEKSKGWWSFKRFSLWIRTEEAGNRKHKPD